tara:strand:+ start:3197 stop:4105 length:909 start_codon:yes stop_codon:yes gene_type:complete
MNTNKKPNFLIVGAMKSATTSLYMYLKEHPDIYLPSIKEPMFFNNINSENKQSILKGRAKKKITSFKKYYDLFKNVNNEIAIGEASPGYLYNTNCAKLIHKYLGSDTKIIVVLRHPVKRAYSNFLHAKRSGKEEIKEFIHAINNEAERIEKNWSPLYHYINQGFYYAQLKKYYKIFPKKNIKVILFNELTRNKNNCLKEICLFLNVNENFNFSNEKKTNVSGLPNGVLGWFVMKLRYYSLLPNIVYSKIFPSSFISFIYKIIYKKPKKLNEQLINDLTNKYYKNDILKLENLISKDLTHWLK